jgi:group I intron endonuclease
MGRIYLLTNSANGKVYIGQTIQLLRERLYGHKHRQDSTRHLCLAIQKYGWEAFAAKELENCENNLLDEREIYYIQLYEADNPKKGYNMTRGGNANRIHSEETRKKISEHNKGKITSPEAKEKMRQTLSGRIFTDETKQKIRDAKANVGGETRRKLSEARKGKVYSDQTRSNMSKGQRKFTYTIIDSEGNIKITDNLNHYCMENYNKSTLAIWRTAINKQEGITRGKFKGWKILQTRKPANCAAEEVRVI